jgi:hypothetical protein
MERVVEIAKVLVLAKAVVLAKVSALLSRIKAHSLGY